MKQMRGALVALILAGRYRRRWRFGDWRVSGAFGRPKALVVAQPERIWPPRLWLSQQPSGLNANHQMPELTAAFQALHREVN